MSVGRLLSAALAAIACAAGSVTASAQGGATVSDLQPLTLAGALETARSGPEMALAGLRTLIADEDYAAATAPLSGEARAGISRAWTPGGASNSAPFGLSLAFNVVQHGPAYERALRAANALELAQVEEQDAWARTRIAVTRAYLVAVRAKEEAVIVEEQGEQIATHLETLQHQLSLGAASLADVRAAESDARRAETDVLAARQGVTAALEALGLLLGQPVHEVEASPALTAPRTDGAPAEPNPSSRADVTAARNRVIDAVLDLAVAQRAAAPRASLTVDGRIAGADGQLDLGLGFDTATFQPRLNATLDPLASLASDQNRVAVRVDVAIPLGGASGAAVAAAEVRLEVARQQYELALMQAELDVSTRLRALDLAAQRLENARLVLASAEAAASETEARFQLGLVTSQAVRSAVLGVERAHL